MANEKRLIDANALLEKVQYRLPFKDMVAEMINEIVEITRKQIVDAPTVDAVEVVHGRWEQCFEDWRKQIEGDKCSVCGFEHYGCGIKHYHYCPNCGAKMDGGNKDG